MTTLTAPIESPCVLMCSIDIQTTYCFGCGRTKDEIGDWITMTPIERRIVMELLPERLKSIERKPRRETRRQRVVREALS